MPLNYIYRYLPKKYVRHEKTPVTSVFWVDDGISFRAGPGSSAARYHPAESIVGGVG